MSHDKSKQSKRNKLITTVVVIFLVIIASYFGINIEDINSTGWLDDFMPPSQTEDVQSSNEDKHSQVVKGELILTMIDVGQADSFLLEQNGTTALIDCGTRSTGKDVVKYLKEEGIEKIDYLFGTHPHDDHMGGMYEIITNIEVGTIIIPKTKAGAVTSNWYAKLMKELKEGDYNLEYVSIGTIYDLGEAEMKILGPISEAKDLNDYSTVMKVSLGEMDIMFTGDAEIGVEAEILASGEDLEAEILKVGHHGSETSTSEAFLEAVSPEYALISAKVGNDYEHSKESTMEKLKERDIEVYRTDESGTVVARITTDSASFSTEPGDYLSGLELEKKEGK